MPPVVVDVITLADEYIESRLVSDPAIQAQATGGVWNEAAPQGTTGRIVRYAYQRGGSARQTGDFGAYEVINNEIVHENLIYLVLISGENERFQDLKVGADRIKQLLHGVKGTVEGGEIYSHYLSPHKERVPEGDQFYPELGGYYELTVQPLPT